MRVEEQIRLLIVLQCSDCDAQYQASVNPSRSHFATMNPCPCGSSKLLMLGVKIQVAPALDMVCAAAGLRQEEMDRIELHPSTDAPE